MLLFGKEGIVQIALFTLTAWIFLSLKFSNCVGKKKNKTKQNNNFISSGIKSAQLDLFLVHLNSRAGSM